MIAELNHIQFLTTLQVYTCFFLTGLIWTIQLVHYPGFAFVEDSTFVKFSQFHSKRISFIVVPVMLTELLSALMLWFRDGENHSFWLWNFVGVLLIWLATFTLSVPCHTLMSKGKDLQVIQRLVQTNWPRTLIWTLRSFLLAGQFWGIT